MRRAAADAGLAGLPMAVAAVLAVWSINFGLPYLFRPDEDVLVGRSVRMAAEGSLDPLFQNWPPLVFYLLAAAEAVVAAFGGGTLQGAVGGDPSAAYLTGRLLSAAATVAMVGFTYLAGRHAYGRTAGGIAALILAVAPLAVRQAHFATTDAVQAALVAAALWAALRANGPRGILVAGALCGLAAAAKYSGGVALVAVFVLAFTGEERRRRVQMAVLGALVAFAVPGSIMLLHPVEYLGGLAFLGGNAYGVHHQVPIGLIYHPTVSLPFGLGLSAYALAIAGIGVAAGRRERADLALLAYVAVFIALNAPSREVFFRYMLPLLPALAMLAGGVMRVLRGRARRLGPAAAVVLLLPSAYASIQTDRLLGMTDTRRVAAQWMDANLPPGTGLKEPYYGGPYYDQGVVDANRRWVDDPLAAGFRQGRYTTRYRINPPDPDVTLVASDPPAQFPVASEPGAAAVFLPYSGDPPAGAVYDTLDSFYLPIWGFGSIERPGPAIAIYRR
jgi:4-amino-4-deoxy-L-arabinose transferase-like glycosyltransferase